MPPATWVLTTACSLSGSRAVADTGLRLDSRACTEARAARRRSRWRSAWKARCMAEEAHKGPMLDCWTCGGRRGQGWGRACSGGRGESARGRHSGQRLGTRGTGAPRAHSRPLVTPDAADHSLLLLPGSPTTWLPTQPQPPLLAPSSKGWGSLEFCPWSSSHPVFLAAPSMSCPGCDHPKEEQPRAPEGRGASGPGPRLHLVLCTHLWRLGARPACCF